MRRWVGWVAGPFALAFLLLSCIAPLASAAPFDGLLRPSSSVLSQGTLTLEGASDASRLVHWSERPTETGPGRVDYRASVAQLAVVEIQWQTLMSPDGPVIPPEARSALRGEVGAHTTLVDLTDPQLYLLRHRDENRWYALDLSSDQPLRLAFNSSVACEIDPEPKHPSAIPAPPGELPAASPTVTNLVVSAGCDGGDLTINGPHLLSIFGTDLRFEERQADGQVERLDVPTGWEVRRNTTNVFAFDHIYREARLRTLSEDAHLRMARGHRYDVQAPLLAIAGKLRIPPSEGVLRWGDAQLQHRIEATQPEGTFVIGPEDGSALRIRGDAEHVAASAEAHAPILPLGSTGVLAIVAGIGLLAALRPLWGFASALFTRITQNAAMDNDRRKTIVEAVSHEPGIRGEELARRLGWRRSLLDYHLGVLCRQGLLVCRRFGRARVLFCPGLTSAREQETIYRMRLPSFQSVLKALKQHPYASHSELADLCRLSRPQVSRILKELTSLGLLRKETMPEGGFRLIAGGNPGAPVSNTP